MFNPQIKNACIKAVKMPTKNIFIVFIFPNSVSPVFYNLGQDLFTVCLLGKLVKHLDSKNNKTKIPTSKRLGYKTTKLQVFLNFINLCDYCGNCNFISEGTTYFHKRR